MITKEEMDQIDYIRLAVSRNEVISQDAVDFLIKTKREADSIKQECVAVLQMIRRR